jgi:hypothetical protein
MADSGYRDSKGRFLPHHKNGNDALEENVGDKYGISDGYKGKPENAIGQLIKPNPYQFGPGPKPDVYPQTGNPPNIVTLNDKYRK